MKKLALLVTVLAMTLVAASPALAQAATGQYQDDPGTGDQTLCAIPEGCDTDGDGVADKQYGSTLCAIPEGCDTDDNDMLGGEPVSATGVLEKPDATTYMYGTHAMTDGASGIHYALESDQVSLDDHVGERVTIYGTLVPGYENGQVEGGPPLVSVSRVESAAATEESVRGSITYIGDNSIFVSEDPNLGVEDPGYCEKTYEFLLSEDTEILRQQNGESAPVSADELQVGQLIEATYTSTPGEALPAICPTQRTVDSIVILEESRNNPPGNSDNGGAGDDSGDGSDSSINVLPDTGGSVLPVLGIGALLILGGLLARRIGG